MMTTDSSKKLKVWILQTGEPLHIDEGNPRPMRAMNLANALVLAGHNVVLWSSAFFHSEKKHRTKNAESINVSKHLEIRLIPSTGYKRNIGPGRLWDHAVMARNLSKELKKVTEIPDVAFVGYPPIETAAVMGNWLTRHSVKYIIDVKDQWPSIFVESLPMLLQPIGRIGFSPYFMIAKRALKKAPGISGMSHGFVNWVNIFSDRDNSEYDCVVPLTKPNDQVLPEHLAAAGKWWDERGIKNDGTPRVCFVGSHSPAFDVEPIYRAAHEMLEAGNPCQFIICGDGPNSAEWRLLMSGLSNVFFPGWVDRAQGESLGLRSVAALGPYHNVDNFILNLPNKIIDSLAQGLPILSPLKGEVMTLITKYQVGLSYGEGADISLAICINRLISEYGLRENLSQNAKALFEKEFSYEKVYGGLVSHLEFMAKK